MHGAGGRSLGHFPPPALSVLLHCLLSAPSGLTSCGIRFPPGCPRSRPPFLSKLETTLTAQGLPFVPLGLSVKSPERISGAPASCRRRCQPLREHHHLLGRVRSSLYYPSLSPVPETLRKCVWLFPTTSNFVWLTESVMMSRGRWRAPSPALAAGSRRAAPPTGRPRWGKAQNQPRCH